MTDKKDELEYTVEEMAQIMADYTKAEHLFKTLGGQLNGLEGGVVLWHTAKILSSLLNHSWSGEWEPFLVALKNAIDAHTKIDNGEVPTELLPKVMN